MIIVWWQRNEIWNAFHNLSTTPPVYYLNDTSKYIKTKKKRKKKTLSTPISTLSHSN